jgi:hypothetical protein
MSTLAKPENALKIISAEGTATKNVSNSMFKYFDF